MPWCTTSCFRPAVRRLSGLAAVLMVNALAQRVATHPPVVRARVDVIGIRDGIRIFVVGSPNGGTGRPAHWHEPPEHNRMHAVYEMPASGSQWRQMTFSFMPTADGEVDLQLRGMCHRLDGVTQRLWILFDDVRVDGAALRNGGFEQAGNNPESAAAWHQQQKDGFRAVRVQGAEMVHSGSAALEVTHDQFASQRLRVTADRIVKVTLWQRFSPNQ